MCGWIYYYHKDKRTTGCLVCSRQVWTHPACIGTALCKEKCSIPYTQTPNAYLCIRKYCYNYISLKSTLLYRQRKLIFCKVLLYNNLIKPRKDCGLFFLELCQDLMNLSGKYHQYQRDSWYLSHQHINDDSTCVDFTIYISLSDPAFMYWNSNYFITQPIL